MNLVFRASNFGFFSFGLCSRYHTPCVQPEIWDMDSLIKGGWGDLNGGSNGPHHEFNSHVNFFMTVFKIVGEETCMNIL